MGSNPNHLYAHVKNLGMVVMTHLLQTLSQTFSTTVITVQLANVVLKSDSDLLVASFLSFTNKSRYKITASESM